MAGMTKDLFEQSLREFRWREPPQPFVVEVMDGTRIEVDDPKAVAFSEGAAVFLSPSYELVEFSCDNVLRIHAAQGAPS
jgi:hypothetical protein